MNYLYCVFQKCILAPGTRINNIPWRLVRDVDYKQDCCWAYLDVDTADAECPHFYERVSAAEVEAIVAEMRSRRTYSVAV